MDYINFCFGDAEVGVPTLLSFRSLRIDEIGVSIADVAPESANAKDEIGSRTATSEVDDAVESVQPGERSVLETGGDSLSCREQTPELGGVRGDRERGDREQTSPGGAGTNVQPEADRIYCSIENEAEDVSYLLDYDEAIRNIGRWQIMQNYSHLIPQDEPRSGSILKAFINFLFGHPKLCEDLQEDKTYVLCLSKVPFCNSSDVHFQILQSIYKTLMNDANCPRFGVHWEEIGFQGLDPASDMRSGGLLSLLQILYFVSCQRSGILAQGIFQMSRDGDWEFPFCSVGINFTVTCLKVLKSGALNRECNAKREVLETMNRLYCSLFHEFYSIWSERKRTVMECSSTLEGIEMRALKHPRRFLLSYERQLSSQ